MRYPPRTFLISTLLFGAVLTCHQPLRRVSLSVLRFPYRVLTLGLRTLLLLPTLPSLGQENASLRGELMQQQQEVAQLRELLRHTQQAQQLVSATPSSSHGILGTVIGRSTIPTQQTILLDKGGEHGLALESVILDAFGVVGRVVELHATTSLVMLLTDTESRIAALVERTREAGLLVGLARGQCQLIYLDAQADIAQGDRIMTAGLGGPFPKGLLLGTAVHISRDEQTGSAMAWVQPAAHIGQLEEVLCLPVSNQ